MRPDDPKQVSMPEGSGIRRFFDHHWEKMVLWSILIALFYLLKPFFLLIFETFLITYITKGIVERVVSRLNLHYRLTTVLVFALFVSLLGVVAAWIGPKLVIESNQILADIAGDGEQQTHEKTTRFIEKTMSRIVGEHKAQVVIGSERYAAIVEALKFEISKAVKTALPKVLGALLHLLKIIWEIVISLILAILFSFILVMDWRKIAGKMKELETSRIRSFYLGVAPHLQAFADVLGKAFRAQAMIATLNTALTAAGLWFFDMPSIALLSTIVFLCGFIPILGTFLSSIPILIFGVQVGGLTLAIQLIALIAVVHALEAYVFNPRITGSILHVHPILVLILLLIGERFFGIWGMVLGVPIGYYVISVLTQKDETLTADSPENSASV